MGDVYMVNGKILSGLPNHAKDIEFDNTGTTLSSTNTEDAIKEVNSNLSQKITRPTGFDTVNTITLTATPQTAPEDGLVIAHLYSVAGHYYFNVGGINFYGQITTNGVQDIVVPIFKGQTFYYTAQSSGTGTGTYYPYTYA